MITAAQPARIAYLDCFSGIAGDMLRVLADPAHAFALKQCILSETTAIGLRA